MSSEFKSAPIGLGLDASAQRLERMTVAVIIPTFNHARFLADAISSVLAQTHPADQIIVVDDGSTDSPAAVVGDFPEVRLLQQRNRGLSAARNTGLRSCATSHVVFLDADDRLLPIALEAGLDHAGKSADCAFVYGGFYVVSGDGSSRGPDSDYFPPPIRGDAHLEFLRENLIAVPATVLYRRECLMEEGGFDETLHGCGDYDLYLRMTRRYRITNYPAVVAEYRMHGQNMSNNHMMMLREALSVLRRHERRIVVPSRLERAALRKGRWNWRDFYATRMLGTAHARWGSLESIRLVLQAIKSSPPTVMRWVWRRSLRLL
jgi:glycosyltransferase involved in cell wall biosynthesis